MPEIPEALPTVGSIARRLCVEVHRVEYVIRARGITPSGWAGHARVFSDLDVQRIAAELRRIESGGADPDGDTEARCPAAGRQPVARAEDDQT